MDIVSAPAVDYPEHCAIRVLLVERMSLLREALAAVLCAEDDLDVAAAVDCVTGLLPAARSVRPDIVVINIDLLASAGFHITEELSDAFPGCETLVLADADNATGLRTALDAQVRGLIDKDALPSRLADCIRRVAKGERIVDKTLAIAALRTPPNPFTPRERDVLGAMALGLRSADIAARLHLSSGTVGNYISTIIRKTGARNRLDAVRVAEESGWIWLPGRPYPGRNR
jgi:two-component system, NarL family, response regulator DesR